MNVSRLLAPLLISSLMLAGCANNSATPGASNTVAANVPEGCPATPSVTAQTSDLKRTTFTPVSSWFNIYSATPESAQIVMSTYDVPKDNTYITHQYTDADALVVIKLTDTVTKKAGVGNYSGAPDAKIKVNQVNISSKNLSGGVFDKNGSMEITHLDNDVACGTLKFKDTFNNELTGSFMAKVNKS